MCVGGGGGGWGVGGGGVWVVLDFRNYTRHRGSRNYVLKIIDLQKKLFGVAQAP